MPPISTMRRAQLRRWTYVLLRVFQWTAFITVAVIALSFRPLFEQSSVLPIRSTALAVQGYTLVSLICVIYLALVDRVASRVKPPKTWSAIHDFLDNLQQHYFRDTHAPLHRHRVTLFRWTTWNWKYRMWHLMSEERRWPWSGWFIPTIRSGHTMQRSSTRFWASSEYPESVEGIPGQILARNQVLVLNNLPDLHSNPSEEDFDKYARATAVSKDWLKGRIKANKPCARSFCGIPVEVENKFWGVIVIDSRSQQLPNSAELREVYGLFGRLLANMLQGGG